MGSYLDFEGKYDPNRRFVIRNWTDEDVNSFWNSRPIVIKAGDMYECEHAIAYKLCKEIVDREMFKDADKAAAAITEHAAKEKVRERAQMGMLNKDLRKPYEDKTISELRDGEENPIMAKMRAEIRAEEQAKINNESNAAAAIPRTKGEFQE